MAGLETVDTIERIASFTESWLDAEVIAANTGRNSYLDDYDAYASTLGLPFDDSRNTSAQKTQSHFQRYRLWSSMYAAEDFAMEDEMAAKMAFAPLMFVAGAFRVQCYLEAQDANAFRQRRENQSVSVDVSRIVRNTINGIGEHLPLHTIPDTIDRLDAIVSHSRWVNTRDYQAHHRVIEWAGHNNLPAEPTSKPVEDMRRAQTLAVSLAVAHIMVAASMRDNRLEKVPMYTAKSITDAELHYPFSES